ncbi:MAG: hypothetical protein BWY17_05373 [Deltaproteobacteria bacterium ADurb.Bin207]|nr:MAG: hypothetical protein BWY17_05373 [Deltaproteobacteria bacterium ADurb.Bin207]
MTHQHTIDPHLQFTISGWHVVGFDHHFEAIPAACFDLHRFNEVRQEFIPVDALLFGVVGVKARVTFEIYEELAGILVITRRHFPCPTCSRRLGIDARHFMLGEVVTGLPHSIPPHVDPVGLLDDGVDLCGGVSSLDMLNFERSLSTAHMVGF